MTRQIWAVALNTFTESIRQPVFVVLLLGTLFFLALNPAICTFTFDPEDDQKLLIELGLSTMFVAGLLLAAFSATGVVAREIETQTVLTVVSKPVGRPTFVLGKYLGVAAALGVAYGCWSLGFLLSVRHGVLPTAVDPYDAPVLVFGLGALAAALLVALWGNYYYRWVFASALAALLTPLLGCAYALILFVDKEWHIQPPSTNWNVQLGVALLMLFEALAVLCAVALAASIRLKLVMTVLLCAGVFLLGLSSDYLFGAGAEQGHLWASLCYRLVPNLGYLWQSEALFLGREIGFEHCAWVSSYVVLYIAGLLSLAMALFQTREVG